MLGRLLEALLTTRHRADLAGQADLAEHQQVMLQRPVAQAGNHGCHQRQIGGGFQHLDPADHVEEYVLIVGRDATVAVQHRQQHGQAVLIQAQGDAARVAQVAGVDQRLHLHQHRPRAFPGGHHDAAGHCLLRACEKDRRGVGHFLEALVGHAEHAQFVDRAETILHRPQQAQATVGLALEIQHGIDHMLQHARAGQRALLGDVADQEDRRAALFGEAHQQRRTLAHLGHAAGCRLQLLGEDGLDRVDHHHLGLFLTRGGDDRLDAGLGHHLQLVLWQVQAPRAHGHLLLRLLAGNVQRRETLSDIAQGLQQDGRLADAGVAADQHHRTIDQATTEYPVELAGGGRETRNFLDADLGQGLDIGLVPGPTGAPTGRGALDHGFHQGVPGAALTTLPRPLGKGGAALGAAVHAFCLGHCDRSCR